MKARLQSLSIIAAAILLASCSGSQNAAEGPVVDMPPVEAIDLRSTETFDSTPYKIDTPAIAGSIEHNVPADLMSGSGNDDVTLRTVSGFRIQIHSSLIKDEAVQNETQVRSWWESLDAGEKPDGLGTGELSAYLFFQSPYYRVRIGNFGQRSEAEAALVLVRESFPNAFIAVDTVKIYR